MVEILQPEDGQTVDDPTCGSGGMLLETVHYMEREGPTRTRSRSTARRKSSTPGPSARCRSS